MTRSIPTGRPTGRPKGSRNSPDAIARMAESKRGFRHSEASRTRMRNAKAVTSDETRERMRQAALRRRAAP